MGRSLGGDPKFPSLGDGETATGSSESLKCSWVRTREAGRVESWGLCVCLPCPASPTTASFYLLHLEVCSPGMGLSVPPIPSPFTLFSPSWVSSKIPPLTAELLVFQLPFLLSPEGSGYKRNHSLYKGLPFSSLPYHSPPQKTGLPGFPTPTHAL